MTKPLIGLNADFRAAARSTPAYSYIAAGYFQSIAAAGGIPVIVPPMDDPQSISTVLDQLNGFVMIGGADLGEAISELKKPAPQGQLQGELSLRGARAEHAQHRTVYRPVMGSL